MFHPDAMNFRQFYSSAVGRRVMQDISSAIRRFWPDCKGDTLAGLGFALPYLGHVL